LGSFYFYNYISDKTGRISLAVFDHELTRWYLKSLSIAIPPLYFDIKNALISFTHFGQRSIPLICVAHLSQIGLLHIITLCKGNPLPFGGCPANVYSPVTLSHNLVASRLQNKHLFLKSTSITGMFTPPLFIFYLTSQFVRPT